MIDDAEIIDLAGRLGLALKARGWMLVTAESCTGGWLSMAVTAIPGSSNWFDRGFVVYTYAAKQEVLAVNADNLRQHGAVSEIVVAEMARGALARSQAQVGVAISGIAGPDGGTPSRPVGTVCFAWCTEGSAVATETCRFAGDRAGIRRQSVSHALRGLIVRC